MKIIGKLRIPGELQDDNYFPILPCPRNQFSPKPSPMERFFTRFSSLSLTPNSELTQKQWWMFDTHPVRNIMSQSWCRCSIWASVEFRRCCACELQLDFVTVFERSGSKSRLESAGHLILAIIAVAEGTNQISAISQFGNGRKRPLAAISFLYGSGAFAFSCVIRAVDKLGVLFMIRSSKPYPSSLP